MWTFVCRHGRVLDFIKAHIATPCEAMMIVPITSPPNPCRVNSFQKEVKHFRKHTRVCWGGLCMGPHCPQILAPLFSVLCTLIELALDRDISQVLLATPGRRQQVKECDSYDSHFCNQMSGRRHRWWMVKGTVCHGGADFAELMVLWGHSWGWLPGTNQKAERPWAEIKTGLLPASCLLQLDTTSWKSITCLKLGTMGSVTPPCEGHFTSKP